MTKMPSNIFSSSPELQSALVMVIQTSALMAGQWADDIRVSTAMGQGPYVWTVRLARRWLGKVIKGQPITRSYFRIKPRVLIASHAWMGFTGPLLTNMIRALHALAIVRDVQESA